MALIGWEIDGVKIGEWLEDSTGTYRDGDFSRYEVDGSEPESDSDSVWVCNSCECVVDGESCPECDSQLW